MQTVDIKLTEIKPYEKNAKKHPESQVKNVAESIKQFGWAQPIVVDENNEIIIGHGRLLAAKRLKLDTAPCYILKGLTTAQKRKLRLLDNKLNESEWDIELLKDEIPDLDFSDFADIDWGIITPEEEKEVVEDEPPEIDKENDPIVKLGDIWQLGEHRLMCGDSTDAATVEKLINGDKADLLFTDPPYNVSIENKSKEILKNKNYAHIENDNLPLEEFKEFLSKIFINANNALKKDASYYVFSCQGGDSEMMMMMMREAGIRCRHQIIWVKDAPVFSMGRLDYD